MLYLLCLVPPVAVLMAGKPFQAIIALGLTLLLYVPGVIYAFLVVNNHYADKRTKRLERAIRESGRPSSS